MGKGFVNPSRDTRHFHPLIFPIIADEAQTPLIVSARQSSTIKAAELTRFGNCSCVGQTSGLTVHGASGAMVLGRKKLRARGPSNRQTGGLTHST